MAEIIPLPSFNSLLEEANMPAESVNTPGNTSLGNAGKHVTIAHMITRHDAFFRDKRITSRLEFCVRNAEKERKDREKIQRPARRAPPVVPSPPIRIPDHDLKVQETIESIINLSDILLQGKKS